MPSRTPYTLSVPLDASAITHSEADGPVKVVARGADGSVASTVVDLRDRAEATAKLGFAADPGNVKIAVGPATATDDHILTADTLGAHVPGRLWIDTTSLTLTPIKIGPWYWGWWRRWCRTITVRGRLVCPDGGAVPGAVVTAYDIDSWFIWTSEQQVGTATTGPDGSFQMTFTWCCGYYPWWWWFRVRPWVLDPVLADHLHRTVELDRGERLGAPTANPSLSVLAPLLDGQDRFSGRTDLASLDPKILDELRGQLVSRLPVVPELEKLQIWPWAPWTPWFDCTPDLIFKATQDCGRGEVQVYTETVTDTRWNVPDEFDVVLVATSAACCRPVDDPEDDCLIVDQVCSVGMHHVAGNHGAPVAPAAVTGYEVTTVDGVDEALDRPFGGTVPVSQNPSDLVGVDYYAFEHSTDGGATFNPVPAGTSAAFYRSWMLFPGPTTGSELFAPVVVGPYEVYETRRHFEDTHYGDWSPIGDRFWLSTNYNLLSPLASAQLADGVHHFRVVQFTQTAPGEFEGPEPVIGCDGETQAGFVLAIDNRSISPVGHDPAHNCGGGVHVCTVEPDTHILAVRVNGVEVGPCDTIMSRDGLTEIEFLAEDPVDGHLGHFALTSHYGTSGLVDLLGAPGATLVSLSGGPDASSYADALAGGATRPTWHGGRFVLTLRTGLAFPEPCCYLLRLEAYKRTRESCETHVRNVSEITLGVGI